jgi:DNA gyrase inhibitor GyrI
MPGLKTGNVATGLDYRQRICRAMNFISRNLDREPSLPDVPGGPHAVCEFDIPMTGFGAAWEEAFKWVVQSGLECADRACYELYHDDCRGKTCRFDICIPLKKK